MVGALTHAVPPASLFHSQSLTVTHSQIVTHSKSPDELAAVSESESAVAGVVWDSAVLYYPSQPHIETVNSEPTPARKRRQPMSASQRLPVLGLWR